MKLIDYRWIRDVVFDVYSDLEDMTNEMMEDGSMKTTITTTSIVKPSKHRRGLLALYDDGAQFRIGYSICAIEDTFKKEEAFKVAEERAATRDNLTPSDEEINKWPDHLREDVMYRWQQLLFEVQKQSQEILN